MIYGSTLHTLLSHKAQVIRIQQKKIKEDKFLLPYTICTEERRYIYINMYMLYMLYNIYNFVFFTLQSVSSLISNYLHYIILSTASESNIENRKRWTKYKYKEGKIALITLKRDMGFSFLDTRKDLRSYSLSRRQRQYTYTQITITKQKVEWNYHLKDIVLLSSGFY